MRIVRKILAVVLLALGVLTLVYKGFTFTKESHTAEIGALEFKVKDRERVNVPTWVGIVLIAAGGVLLLVPSRKG